MTLSHFLPAIGGAKPLAIVFIDSNVTASPACKLLNIFGAKAFKFSTISQCHLCVNVIKSSLVDFIVKS